MNICVYCSASNRIADTYKQAARTLGRHIGLMGHTLVFGGATGGLMTEVSEGAREAGAHIIGVVPDRIIQSGRESKVVDEQMRVGRMSERKQQMRDLADMFIVMPGSYGSMDELFDAVASGTVGEHHKPLVLFSMNGFYDHLLMQIERMKRESFIPREESYTFTTAHDMDELLHAIERTAADLQRHARR